MQGKIFSLAASIAGRPVLMEGGALEAYARRVQAIDAEAFARPSRFGALLRKLSPGRSPALAMEDEDYPPPPLEERLAYAPRYIGEPDDQGYCWTLKDGIALMAANTPLLDEGEDYCGVVYHGYDTLLAGMQEAAADMRVKAIFLKLDSPGGVASGGLLYLAQWMRANRAAAGGKPIWCYAKQACSAAYWIAAQCDVIATTAMSFVGSIGAYTLHEDYSGALDKAGIKITEFKVFAQKTDGAPWKPISPEASQDIQADIGQCVQYFVRDVAAGRPVMTAEKQEALQSRCFTGDHDDPARSGLKLGLVDELASEQAFYEALLAKISGPADNPQTASVGTRAASIKEQPMAGTAPKKTAAELAARAAERQRLEAALSTIRAEEAAETAAPATPEDEDDDETDPEKKDPDAPVDPDAKKIAGSAEAKLHPHMANAAIASGQTYAQFKASVAALADAPKGNALDRQLSGSRRLGPDAAQPGAPAAAASIDTAKIYATRRGGTRR